MKPYIGQISMVAFKFAPEGWLVCDGSEIDTNDYQYRDLYEQIGTTYGGGNRSFKLPDLRKRAALNYGQGPGLTNYTLGATAGVKAVNSLTAVAGTDDAHSVIQPVLTINYIICYRGARL